MKYYQGVFVQQHYCCCDIVAETEAYKRHLVLFRIQIKPAKFSRRQLWRA